MSSAVVGAHHLAVVRGLWEAAFLTSCLFTKALDCFVFLSFRCWFASPIIREAEQTKRAWAVTTRSSNKVHLFMVINVYKNTCHIYYFSHPLQQIARFSWTRSWKMKMCEQCLQSISSSLCGEMLQHINSRACHKCTATKVFKNQLGK